MKKDFIGRYCKECNENTTHVVDIETEEFKCLNCENRKHISIIKDKAISIMVKRINCSKEEKRLLRERDRINKRLERLRKQMNGIDMVLEEKIEALK